MPPDPASPWLTVREAAALLGNVWVDRVYKMLRNGDLAGIRIEGAHQVSRASVEAYLARQTAAKETPAAEPQT